jgi:hypothetical protein
MAQIGTNIGFKPTPDRLALLDQVPNVRALRWPLRLESDDTWLIQALLTRGILPWVVLDHDALGSDATNNLREYARRYESLGVVWEVGNEPDIESPSSWTMSQDVFSGLLTLARMVLGDEAYIVAGGLASGQPDWLDTVNLSRVNAVAVHPYGKWPTNLPVREGWGFGPVTPLLQAYRDKLDSMGHASLTLHVTEYGAPYNELQGAYPKYVRDMTATLATSSLVGYALQFCLTDRDVDQFGLFDVEGRRRADLDAPAPVPAPAPTPPPSPDGFVIGQGLRDLMTANGEVPATDELFFGSPERGWSEAYSNIGRRYTHVHSLNHSYVYEGWWP